MNERPAPSDDEVNELIAWLRAPKDLTFEGIDPATGEPAEISGWRDPDFVQPPTATPVPNCWKDAFGQPSTAPSSSPGASGSPAPSGSAAPSEAPAGTVIKITAQNIAFDVSEIEVAAGQPFQIEFVNNDAGIPHNVAIHEGSPTGTAVWTGEIVTGVTTITYDVPGDGLSSPAPLSGQSARASSRMAFISPPVRSSCTRVLLNGCTDTACP